MPEFLINFYIFFRYGRVFFRPPCNGLAVGLKSSKSVGRSSKSSPEGPQGEGPEANFEFSAEAISTPLGLIVNPLQAGVKPHGSFITDPSHSARNLLQ